MTTAGSIVAFQFEAPSGGLVDVRGEVRWSMEDPTAPAGQSGFGVMVHEAPISFREFFLWAQNQAEKQEEPEEL